ncbi:MAG: glycosyltransferase family 92 protein [Desulfovibrio sp.]|nr:glycosyltransferase family 92 protein [Desulfovibrio sp.]
MKYCALCCIARDEDRYIEEWVEYHLLQGFDTVIIYDNHSSIPIKDTLSDFVADQWKGRVLIHMTEGEFIGVEAQKQAYAHCMRTYKDDFMWIAVIDVDEIIVPKKCTNIKQLLAEFENYGGVVLNWAFYGGDGGETYKKSQINSFTYTAQQQETTIKSIVRPQRVEKFTGPHGAFYVYPYYAVTLEHFPLEPDVYSAPSTVSKAQVNHYYYRSREDWQLKVAKWKLSRLNFGDNYDDAIKVYKVYDSFALDLFSLLKMKAVSTIPVDFTSINDLTCFFIKSIEHKVLYDSLEISLCDCACKFQEEPMIWYFRSVLSRMRGDNELALHFIKQASKLSGSSTVYFELARVYQALGLLEHSHAAEEQAKYKKQVEDATCG